MSWAREGRVQGCRRCTPGALVLAQTRDGVMHSFRMIVVRPEMPALGFGPFPLLFLFFLLMSVMGSAETWERKLFPFKGKAAPLS